MKNKPILKTPGSNLPCGEGDLIPKKFMKKSTPSISKLIYSGRPTRRYAKLCKRLQKAENISDAEIATIYKKSQKQN